MPQESKVGKLGALSNNWITALTGVLVASVVLVGWAKGVLDLPDRISHLEQTQTEMKLLPNRVGVLENQVAAQTADIADAKNKVSADHDLIVHISATLDQMQRDQENDRAWQRRQRQDNK